ncbi:unnamed protein product [Orchesella dallaii]|uniref:Protein quiver n=1 Tax=Orchesella dallaii TaxID=48710 RepID=A0ABP1RLZ3_9HEXA
MANKIFPVFITLLVIIVASAEALKCYECQYWDGKLADGTTPDDEDSCENGKTPKDELSVDCSTLEYKLLSDGRYFGVPQSFPGLFNMGWKDSTAISPHQTNNNTAYSCVKSTLDGILLATNETVRTTYRTCVMEPNTTQSLPDKCYANKLSKILADIKEPVLASFFEGAEAAWDGSSDAGICSCSEDNCNGAINSANVSGFVLVVSTLFAYFSKFL